jgi:DNA-binding NtrC family response regulator
MADSEIAQVVMFLDHIGNLPPPIQQELHRQCG